ncbi:alpha beta-hydrolase [Fusarium sp. NRRL 52700]|nr:alpha beta-hydrolase [Fusarium sp. NRRL 52700]
MSFLCTTKLIQLQDDVHLHAELSFPSQAPIQRQEYPTIVFLHFWGGSSKTWPPVNDLIALSFPTVRLDFRGWGSSTGPADETKYSILQLAQDVEQVIIQLKLQKYIIIGHSMGAKVAQAVAGRKRVSGLVGLILLCPAPPTPLMLPEEMRDQQISAYDNAKNAEFVARNVLTAKHLPDGTINGLVKDMLKGSPFAKAAWPRYAMQEDILELAKRISVSSIVIAGGKDQVEPVARVKAEVLGSIFGAKFLVLEEVGHLTPLEAPEKLAEIICDFASSTI